MCEMITNVFIARASTSWQTLIVRIATTTIVKKVTVEKESVTMIAIASQFSGSSLYASGEKKMGKENERSRRQRLREEQRRRMNRVPNVDYDYNSGIPYDEYTPFISTSKNKKNLEQISMSMKQD